MRGDELECLTKQKFREGKQGEEVYQEIDDLKESQIILKNNKKEIKNLNKENEKLTDEKKKLKDKLYETNLK